MTHHNGPIESHGPEGPAIETHDRGLAHDPDVIAGRWPHVHFEVFRNGLFPAGTGRSATRISHSAVPAAIIGLA